MYAHGTCCGAAVIDGFFDQSVYPGNMSYPTHERLIEALRTILMTQTTWKGTISVILNQAQNPVWQADLERFGFKLVNADCSNPNHSNNPDSQLFLYVRVQRYFQGDRRAAGLEPALPTVAPIPPAPPPPPPPPAPAWMTTQVVNWGVPIR